LNQSDLADVYQMYFPKIYNFIFYKVMHKEITEDLVSTVFLRVVEKFDTYNPDKGAISTWLFAIAENILIDYFRSRKISVSLEELDSAEPSVDFEEQSSLIEDETRRELYDALSELDSRTRYVIAQKYFSGKSIRKIAEEKQMNESTVSTIHNRGLKKLRKVMER